MVDSYKVQFLLHDVQLLYIIYTSNETITLTHRGFGHSLDIVPVQVLSFGTDMP